MIPSAFAAVLNVRSRLVPSGSLRFTVNPADSDPGMNSLPRCGISRAATPISTIDRSITSFLFSTVFSRKREYPLN